jgi:phage-related protein
VWKFVVKIAGKVKEFVLDCIEKICEAASWVWEKVKVGWNKLVDFVGFIFN